MINSDTEGRVPPRRGRAARKLGAAVLVGAGVTGCLAAAVSGSVPASRPAPVTNAAARRAATLTDAGQWAGLTPRQLVAAYSATSLAAEYGGRGGTVVFFEWSPPVQSDLDAFTKATGLPPIHPVVVGNLLNDADAAIETELDLETVHAIAPQAQEVIVAADPRATGQQIGDVFTRTEAAYPGAVWSLSIGWRQCNAAWTAADLAPAEAALEVAEARGTSAFDASGDTGGLECKGEQDYAAPPTASDVGYNAIGALPAMTSVGGTYLAVDQGGKWLAEEAWSQPVMTQGTAGGVADLFGRPSWQNADGVSAARDSSHRLLPDVSADADPASGLGVVLGGSQAPGGGTSMAAPIWAGLTLLMDEYLTAHGGHLLGSLNPLLYQVARGAALPGFHDITLGANAVDSAAPGYDLVTGLGSPVADNLARDLLDAERHPA